MESRILQLIAALRAGGVRVSLAESAEAFSAVDLMGIQNREEFRLSLRTTLVKDVKDLPTFDKLFPLFFGSGQPPMMGGDQTIDVYRIMYLILYEVRKIVKEKYNHDVHLLDHTHYRTIYLGEGIFRYYHFADKEELLKYYHVFDEAMKFSQASEGCWFPRPKTKSRPPSATAHR